MREQIRLWFYSQSFMSVTLVGPLAVPQRAHVREAARRDGPRDAQSWGNAIDAERGVRADGRRRDALAVLRAAAEPEPAVRLRPGATRSSGGCSRSGTPSRSSSRTRTSRTSARVRRPGAAAGELQPLDRWLVARTRAARRATRRRASTATGRRGVAQAFEAFVDDLSNWYIRRSRRRFWDVRPGRVPDAVDALVQATAGHRAGDAVPRRELWRNLSRGVRARRSRCSSRRWPEPGEVDDALLAEVAELRERGRARDGRRARDENVEAAAAAAPARRLRSGARRGTHLDEIKEELRVKEVEFRKSTRVALRYKPNLRVLGPKLGAAAARRCGPRCEAGASRRSDDGRLRVAGRSSSRTRCSSSVRQGGRAGALGDASDRRARPERSTTSSARSAASST